MSEKLSEKSFDERLKVLKMSKDENQKILLDVQETLKSCRETQAKISSTQEKLKKTNENNDNVQNGVKSLERRWQEFQDAFDQMNKQMINNIAEALGKSHLTADREVKHQLLSIEDCVKLLCKPNCRNIVVLTGAGMSVESGIPTYRDDNGYWTKGSKNYTPQEIATKEFFDRNPTEQWKHNFRIAQLFQNSKPNEGHHKLKELEDFCIANGKNFQLITQNIDALHLKVGHTNEVYCIHGDMRYARCPNVGYNCCDQANVKVAFPKLPKDVEEGSDKDILPKCKECGNILRPHVLWFDENYSESLYKLTSTLEAVGKADILIVIGTTYQTNLPRRILGICQKNKVPVIDVNPNLNSGVCTTDLLQIEERASKFLSKLITILKRQTKKNTSQVHHR